MSPKFYIKSKDRYNRKYYPVVEGVIFEQYPCETASEAQEIGLELFKLAVETHRDGIHAYREGEIKDG